MAPSVRSSVKLRVAISMTCALIFHRLNRGQWQVKDNDLWIYFPPNFPTLTKTNTQVNYNSNGYPILKGGDGTEYMMCK